MTVFLLVASFVPLTKSLFFRSYLFDVFVLSYICINDFILPFHIKQLTNHSKFLFSSPPPHCSASVIYPLPFCRSMTLRKIGKISYFTPVIVCQALHFHKHVHMSIGHHAQIKRTIFINAICWIISICILKLKQHLIHRYCSLAIQ